MHIVHVLARLALGAVFVMAGASKVASGPTWPVQAQQLGVSRSVAVMVPWFELAVGALVAVGVGEPWPAVVGCVTLLVFTAVLVRTLRTGRHPPCACFGAWSAAPLGRRHVLRNSGFVALALVAILTT